MSPLKPVAPPLGRAVGDVAGIAGIDLGDVVGADESLGQFEATAYGPPWDSINGTGITKGGTDLRGAAGRGKYIIAIDPSVLKMGSKYKVNPNPFGDPNIEFLADDIGGAIQGKRIDIFDWRGRTTQRGWGIRTVNVSESKGGIPGPGDVAGGALDVVDFVADFVGTILDFRKLGELWAKSIVWLGRTFGGALWDYALGPAVHWNERAVFYYWETYYGSGSGRSRKRESVYYRNAGVVTLIFWSFGYAILWHRPDTKRAEQPRDTMLGQAVRSLNGQAARRHLTKPEKVQEKTPIKPTPKKSQATIVRTRELTTTRRRPVRVTGTPIATQGAPTNGNASSPVPTA